MKYYVVFFDRQPNAAYSAFHKDFVAHPRIKKWWHYIKSAYLIGSDLSASELSKHARAVFEKHKIPNTHLVLAVDLKQRQGMLTEDAWKWFRENALLDELDELL